MLMMKKAQALSETILWIIVVMLVSCIGLPVALVVSLAGMFLRMFRIEFVANLAAKLIDMIIAFLNMVTRRIRTRTDEIEALRAQLQ